MSGIKTGNFELSLAITTDCVRCMPHRRLEEGSIYRVFMGESNTQPFSVTPLSEDMDFNVPQWIMRAVRDPEC